MNLTAPTQTLELVTSAATQASWAVSWTDIDQTGATSVLPGSAQGLVAAATTTLIVPAPAASIYRVVTSLALNIPGGTQTLSIQKDVSATNYPLCQALLAANESLHYEDADGWYSLNANGSRKNSGATGTPGINGGGTILGTGTSIVNFGGGLSHTTLVVTGQPLVVAGSLVYCWLKPEATADHTADEHLVETIKVFASNIVAGVGFTLHALNASERFEPLLPAESLFGRFLGAGQANGPGQPARGAKIVGGRGTLITGQWSVGWMFTQ